MSRRTTDRPAQFHKSDNLALVRLRLSPANRITPLCQSIFTTVTIPIDAREPRPQADYAADRAAFSSSRSFSAAILFQCFAIRSKNFRSSKLLVFEAYHSHWRAFSAHSAIVSVIARLSARRNTPCSIKMLVAECLCDRDHRIVEDVRPHQRPQSSSVLSTDGAAQKEKAPFAHGP